MTGLDTQIDGHLEAKSKAPDRPNKHQKQGFGTQELKQGRMGEEDGKQGQEARTEAQWDGVWGAEVGDGVAETINCLWNIVVE